MKRCLSALLVVLLLLPVLATAAGAFSDVPYNGWASSYINRASSQGWVKGIGGDRYGPDLSVNAAEFFTMVANAFFPDELAAQPKGEVWYAQVWAMAQTLGLQNGSSIEDKEQLTVPLARQDMAQIIYNVLAAKGLPLPQDSDKTFADWEEISPDCRSAVAVCAELGILNGIRGSFVPRNSMTRAEAAAVLCRLADALFPVEVTRLVNIERAKEGLRPLTLDPVLTAAARIRAEDLQVLFSHTRPNGESCMMALAEVGADPYSYIRSGENIAAGFGSPEAVMNGWMNSPGHRSNILTGAFTLIGVGYQNGKWVQMFGRPDD